MKTQISKELIKKAEELTGDDTGYIDSLETLIDSAKLTTYSDWLISICNGDHKTVMDSHKIINQYCNGDHEGYTKLAIIFYENNQGSCSEDLKNYFESEYQKQLTQD